MVSTVFNRTLLVRGWLRTVAFLLVLARPWASAESAFRIGAVLSSQGATAEMAEARNGYELFAEVANDASNGQGFFLEGKNGTQGFHFKFEFVFLDDLSDAYEHEAHVKRLLKKEKVHFLAGSHPTYAAEEMRLSEEERVLNIQCCVGPDEFYDKGHEMAFGIQASNKRYTETLIRRLALSDVKRMAFVYEEGNVFTRTTCEEAIAYSEELETVRETKEVEHLNLTFSRETLSPEFFKEAAVRSQRKKVDAVIACVFPIEGQLLVNAFHDVNYPLKAFFLTTGPTKQDWVDSFHPTYRADGLFSAAQWHPGIRYKDSLFNKTERYTRLYHQRFKGEVPTYVSAGASAVGVTLMHALQEAFRDCDISATNGDVNALLTDSNAIKCDRGSAEGKERVRHALIGLNIETLFGHVKFDHHQRNIALDPVTTQVFERDGGEGLPYRAIEAVMPTTSATELLRYPAENHYAEKCKPGEYVGPDSFNRCLKCRPGESSYREDAPHCDSCPIGTYTDKAGQSECLPCPPGTRTETRAADSIQKCVCEVGYYNADGLPGLPCEPCMEGAKCDGGTNLPIPLPGYWAHPNHETRVYPCDPPSLCNGGEGLDTCDTGYTGRLCASCEDGYFSVIQKCYRCWSKWKIVLTCFVLLISWYIINVIVSRSVSSLEMILGWAQLANIIGDVSLNWTKMVTTMFGVANLLDFDVDILEPSCLTPWGFKENFLTQLCLPLCMTLMGASGYLGSTIAYVMVKNKWITLDGRRMELLSFIVHVPTDKTQLKEKLDATIATLLASVDVTYVTIAKYCFDVFKCQTIAGVSVLRVSPEVVCGTTDHKLLQGFAAIGIVVYVAGYLAFVCWKLFDLSKKGDFSTPEMIRRFGFIYQKYELDYYYTPAIMLIRKLLFVLVLVYMNNPAFQVGAIAIIINASLLIHVYTAPYVDTYLDVLFNFLLLALMFEAFGGLMFYSENLPDANRRILEWIVMVTLFVLIAVFLVIFILEVFKKYHVRYVKAAHLAHAKEQGDPEDGFWSKWFSRKSSIRKMIRLASVSSHNDTKDVSFELLETFHPSLVYRCVRENPEFIAKWDRLTIMLKDYMSDQSETSYLSTEPIARFWRKLVDRFPELVDFLAVTDDLTRSKFHDFATNLYRDFYLSKKIMPLPLMDVLNWRDYAPMAQWLAIAESDDREFFIKTVAEMFRLVGNAEAADILDIRLQNGGRDPQLQHRPSTGSLTRRQRDILHNLADFATPFQHSASVDRTVSNVSAMEMTSVKGSDEGPSSGSVSPDIARDVNESEEARKEANEPSRLASSRSRSTKSVTFYDEVAVDSAEQ